MAAITRGASRVLSRSTSAWMGSVRGISATAGASDGLKAHLDSILAEAKEAGTFKVERVISSAQAPNVHVQGSEDDVLCMCSNNYLALCDDPRLIEAAKVRHCPGALHMRPSTLEHQHQCQCCGIHLPHTLTLHRSLWTHMDSACPPCASSAAHRCDCRAAGHAGAARLARQHFPAPCPLQDIHKELEKAISEFHGTEDTILYPSCFDANAGLFEGILGPEDAILSDALNHASIIDGVRLCKAERHRYAHMDMADLEAKLQATQHCRTRLIATDGVFSMDGDVAPLKCVPATAHAPPPPCVCHAAPHTH